MRCFIKLQTALMLTYLNKSYFICDNNDLELFPVVKKGDDSEVQAIFESYHSKETQQFPTMSILVGVLLLLQV